MLQGCIVVRLARWLRQMMRRMTLSAPCPRSWANIILGEKICPQKLSFTRWNASSRWWKTRRTHLACITASISMANLTLVWGTREVASRVLHRRPPASKMANLGESLGLLTTGDVAWSSSRPSCRRAHPQLTNTKVRYLIESHTFCFRVHNSSFWRGSLWN